MYSGVWERSVRRCFLASPKIAYDPHEAQKFDGGAALGGIGHQNCNGAARCDCARYSLCLSEFLV